MKAIKLKWFLFPGVFVLLLSQAISQSPYLIDANGKKLAVEQKGDWSTLKISDSQLIEQYDNDINDCYTFVYRSKVQAPSGYKIKLGGAIPLTDNSVINAVSIYNSSQPLQSFLLHLNESGEIKKQVQFNVDGKEAHIMAISPYGNSHFLVAGVISNQTNKIFISKIKHDFTTIETTTVTTEENISEIWMYAIPDFGISIGAESLQSDFVMQLASNLQLQWNTRIIRLNQGNLRGIYFNPYQMIRIGRSKVNGNGTVGHEIIDFNPQNGGILNAWDLPVSFSGESMLNFKGFSNMTSLVGLSKKAGESIKVWHKNLRTNQSFSDRFYEFDTEIDENANILPSQGLDAVAISNGKLPNLFFVFQNLDVNTGPTRSRHISVPANSKIKSFVRTTDAGYQFGLDLLDGKEILLIKTDSAGLLGDCETNDLPVNFFRGEGTKYETLQVSGNNSNFQVEKKQAATSASNLNLQIDCKQNFCPPKPIQDTCSEGYLKIFRSNFFGTGVYEGIIKNDQIFTSGQIHDNYSGVNTVYAGILGKYNLNGAHLESYSFFANGVSVRPQIWPANGDSMILHLTLARNDSMFFILAAIDKEFKILWDISILSYYRYNTFDLAPQIQDIKLDDAGNYYVITCQPNLSITHRNFGIIKLNAKGEMIWNKVYRVTDQFIGVIAGSVGSKGLLLVIECSTPGGFSLLVNKDNGNILNYHSLNNNEGGFVLGAPIHKLHYFKGKFYYLSNGFKNGTSFMMATVFDENGKPEKMIDFGPSYSSTISNFWNGNFDIITNIWDPVTGIASMLKMKLDENLNIIHSVKINPQKGFYSSINMMHSSTGTPIALGYTVEANDPMATNNFLAKFNNDGNPGNCYSEPYLIIPKEITAGQGVFTAVPSEFSYSAFTKFPLALQPFKYGIKEAELLCKSDIKCTVITVSGQEQICDTSLVETYIANSNNDCTIIPQWQFNEDVVQVIERNKDTLKVRFKVAGNHLMKVKINTGCSILEDSILVNVPPVNAILNLGADTTLCPGDSLQLHAGPGFSSYQWNTGATSPSIRVSSPGKYAVAVSNNCGASLKDTMEIFIPTVPLLSVGSDSSVCAGETFQRQASDGFSSYQWKNLSSQLIVSTNSLLSAAINQTTSFAVQAATAIGCTRFDTLTIYAISARPFSLGPNLNLCAGDTATIAAPAEYISYLWNTGSTSNSIQAWQQGQYMLTVTDTNGCKTSDSVRISNVFALPLPNLGPDMDICSGSTLTLNPGNFALYQWHDGSTSAGFTASANGSYSVQVWDNNGCTASDTMRILSQWPLPLSFLNDTDSICQYEKLILQPNGTFKSYVWSTGSTQPAIQVDKAGSYSLRVTDNNNCMGSDTIRVIQKSCMEGVYVPDAFTPNNDNLNDIFRPLVFGNIIKFEFSIYNRLGELIFKTNEPGKGWDGKWKGIQQPSNSYAWVCSYQLEGGEMKVEKGMVKLIR
jgi:gliding motility-associated-like protein